MDVDESPASPPASPTPEIAEPDVQYPYSVHLVRGEGFLKTSAPQAVEIPVGSPDRLSAGGKKRKISGPRLDPEKADYRDRQPYNREEWSEVPR